MTGQQISIIFNVSVILILSFPGCPGPEDDLSKDDTIPLSMTQEHLPWASLADTPWPMYSHDPQGTRRSQHRGPTIGELSWKLWAEGIQSSSGFTSFAIGADSTIYFGSSHEQQSGSPRTWVLYAVSNTGQVKWTFSDDSEVHEEIEVSPIITSDGKIIFATYWNLHANIYALNEDGQKLWKYEHDLSPFIGDYLNMGIDGTIYFIDGDGNLIALNDDGTPKWQLLANQSFKASGQWCGAISPDGYTLYIAGAYGYDPVYAISSEGQVIWSLELPDPTARIAGLPLIDNLGNIYLGISSSLTDTNTTYSGFYSLNIDGTIRWVFPQVPFYEMYTMGPNGHLYLCTGDDLFAVAYNGDELWQMSLRVDVATPMIIDNNHTLFLADNDLRAIDGLTGTILWTEHIPATIFQSPVISFSNTLLLGFSGSDSNKYVYAIK